MNTPQLIAKFSIPARAVSAFLWLGAGWLACGAALANGLDNLEAFVKSTKSGRAQFTQVVTSPARDGQSGRARTSGGTFEFQRPNRFKFSYTKPYEQLIVADGKTLWLYDVDLNQVTARSQDQVLASTPAALIAAAPDLKALTTHFNLAPAPDKDGLEWVEATPKSRDGQLRSIRTGFKGNELAALEIEDGFGQRSVLTFTKVESNANLPASTFQFKPPAGAEVMRP